MAITEGDFAAIPDVLSAPDVVVYGMRNKIGRDQVAYIKKLPDGSTLYIEEMRAGRRRLAMEAMRKYPATVHASSILKTLRPTSKTLRGDKLIVVDNPVSEEGPLASRRPDPDQVGRWARERLGDTLNYPPHLEPLVARVGSLSDFGSNMRRVVSGSTFLTGLRARFEECFTRSMVRHLCLELFLVLVALVQLLTAVGVDWRYPKLGQNFTLLPF